MSEDAGENEAIPPIVHDDIMQRLLDYQRQLREGLTPEEAAESVSAPVRVDRAAPPWPVPTARPTATAELVDLAAVDQPVEMEPAPADTAPRIRAASSITSEPTMMPARSSSPTEASRDLAARLAELEDTLTSVANSIGDLRAQLQNIAITADHRLSAIETALSGAQDAAANGLLIRVSNTISRLLYSDRSGR